MKIMYRDAIMRYEIIPGGEVRGMFMGELVRCRECKYWCDGTISGAPYCVDFLTKDENGYCSWGEKLDYDET